MNYSEQFGHPSAFDEQDQTTRFHTLLVDELGLNVHIAERIPNAKILNHPDATIIITTPVDIYSGFPFLGHDSRVELPEGKGIAFFQVASFVENQWICSEHTIIVDAREIQLLEQFFTAQCFRYTTSEQRNELARLVERLITEGIPIRFESYQSGQLLRIGHRTQKRKIELDPNIQQVAEIPQEEVFEMWDPAQKWLAEYVFSKQGMATIITLAQTAPEIEIEDLRTATSKNVNPRLLPYGLRIQTVCEGRYAIGFALVPIGNSEKEQAISHEFRYLLRQQVELLRRTNPEHIEYEGSSRMGILVILSVPKNKTLRAVMWIHEDEPIPAIALLESQNQVELLRMMHQRGGAVPFLELAITDPQYTLGFIRGILERINAHFADWSFPLQLVRRTEGITYTHNKRDLLHNKKIFARRTAAIVAEMDTISPRWYTVGEYELAIVHRELPGFKAIRFFALRDTAGNCFTLYPQTTQQAEVLVYLISGRGFIDQKDWPGSLSTLTSRVDTLNDLAISSIGFPLIERKHRGFILLGNHSFRAQRIQREGRSLQNRAHRYISRATKSPNQQVVTVIPFEGNPPIGYTPMALAEGIVVIERNGIYLVVEAMRREITELTKILSSVDQGKTLPFQVNLYGELRRIFSTFSQRAFLTATEVGVRLATHPQENQIPAIEESMSSDTAAYTHAHTD